MRLALIALTVLFSGAAFAQQDLSQSGLVGKLENPTIITDPAQWPKKFGEAPALAELVKAGKLPSVDKRISQEPMVIKPLRSVGKYGGTWRRGFLGPGDGENGNRVRSSDKLLFWDVTGTNITPNAAKGWETSADGRRTTLFLRKGMKWSDGAPFTADDFMFWYEDMYQNKDLIKSPAPELFANGKPGRISKVDETTVAVRVRRSAFPVSEPARRRHPGRRRPVAAAVGRARTRPLCTGALSEAVPAEIQFRGKRQRKGQGGRLRQLGAGLQDQVRLAAQPRCADDFGVENGAADQQPDLGPRAQSLFLGDRHAKATSCLISTRCS